MKQVRSTNAGFVKLEKERQSGQRGATDCLLLLQTCWLAGEEPSAAIRGNQAADESFIR
jgi:hypothetical protein